jgi:hypothetical protein
MKKTKRESNKHKTKNRPVIPGQQENNCHIEPGRQSVVETNRRHPIWQGVIWFVVGAICGAPLALLGSHLVLELLPGPKVVVSTYLLRWSGCDVYNVDISMYDKKLDSLSFSVQLPGRVRSHLFTWVDYETNVVGRISEPLGMSVDRCEFLSKVSDLPPNIQVTFDSTRQKIYFNAQNVGRVIQGALIVERGNGTPTIYVDGEYRYQLLNQTVEKKLFPTSAITLIPR